jgi:hypothetical protein
MTIDSCTDAPTRFIKVAGTPIREDYLIVDGRRLAGTGATSYTL